MKSRPHFISNHVFLMLYVSFHTYSKASKYVPSSYSVIVIAGLLYLPLVRPVDSLRLGVADLTLLEKPDSKSDAFSVMLQ